MDTRHLDADTQNAISEVAEGFEKHFGYPLGIRVLKKDVVKAYISATIYIAEHATRPREGIPSSIISSEIGVSLSTIQFFTNGLSPVKCGVIKSEPRYGRNASISKHYYWAPIRYYVQTYLDLVTRLFNAS